MTMTITTAAPAPAASAPAAPAPAPVVGAPAAAPVQAPAAAPVAPPPVATSLDAPAPAPVAEAPAAPAPAPGAPQAVSYEPTGDAGLDLALSFIGQRGIGPDHPAMKAAEAGDFTLLKAHLAQMGDKATGWEHVIAAGEAAYKNTLTSKQAAAQQTQDAILSVFGDDKDAAAKEWGKVTEWARANAEPQERTAVNAALAAGGIAAKAMAAYLYTLYKGNPNAVVEPALVTRNGGRTPGTDTWALSPEAYKQEVSKLTAEKRGAIDNTPEYKVLQQRRMAWRP